MTTAITLTLLFSGSATYYAPELMDQVYTNRLTWRQVQPCPACVGMVALNDPADLGRQVYLDWPGRGLSGPYLVVDCAAANHQAERLRLNRIVEVDWETAQRHAMRGPVAGVRVLYQSPAEAATRGRTVAGWPRAR